MNRSRLVRIACLLPAMGLLLNPVAVFACATCYGASDSAMAQGMNWGIMSLLGFIGTVLGGLVAFFAYIGYRASKHPLPPDPSSTVQH